MIGAFVALDLFLFYVFWELMLIPMYLLIGMWGGQRRVYASIKFVLYTMVGSLLMLATIFYIYAKYGQLTGTLLERPWGDIVDGAEKKRVLLEVCELLGIEAGQAIAVGDGANDIPMMAAAGLSIAYHPKPAVAQQAMVSVVSGGLDQALKIFTP